MGSLTKTKIGQLSVAITLVLGSVPVFAHEAAPHVHAEHGVTLFAVAGLVISICAAGAVFRRALAAKKVE